jgi:formylmethanofuran--tetrahydromethanopterin N-formyltransferase
VALLAFAMSRDKLAAAVLNRTGQCLMTCPTTAVFNGLESDDTIPLGRSLRFFGDGFQKSKLLGERRFWRIPVMDGEFLVEQQAGTGRGIGGGNFLIAGDDAAATLQAARAAVAAIDRLPDCITPFPGGVARSGSKVGSRYRNQIASTAEAWCPTLRGRVTSQLNPRAEAVYEVVIDGTGEPAIRRAMREGLVAALSSAAADRIVQISAGNYGGQLGQCLVPLRELAAAP